MARIDTPQDGHDALLLAALANLVPDREPPLQVRVRLRGQMFDRIAEPRMHVLRAEEGQWRPLLPGVHVKTLRRDEREGTETSLWRFEAGAQVPPHRHHREEECLILEGSVVHGGIEYFAGDYLLAEAGVEHQTFITSNGALLMIRSELLSTPETLSRLVSR